MKLGATLYIKNTIEALKFYKEAFGLTLGGRKGTVHFLGVLAVLK